MVNLLVFMHKNMHLLMFVLATIAFDGPPGC